MRTVIFSTFVENITYKQLNIMEENKPDRRDQDIESKICILSEILKSYHKKPNDGDILLACSHLMKLPLSSIVFPIDGIALADMLTDISNPKYFERDLKRIIEDIKTYVKDL